MTTSIISVLANDIRLQLITCLGRGSKNVSELISNCGLSQSAVSQHLRKLRRSGLVRSEKRGKEVYYHLAYPSTASLAHDLQSFIKKVKS